MESSGANRQVALLRGINVGRAKRVAMADLRALFEGLGYSEVRTLLNSGNVVFTTRASPAKAAARIETEIASDLGVSARVTVLSAQELADAIRENPLVELAVDPSRLLVAVLNNPADRHKLDALMQEDWTPETLAVGTRVAYLWCPQGILDSPLAKSVGAVLGDAVTSRNWSTILKLNTLVS